MLFVTIVMLAAWVASAAVALQALRGLWRECWPGPDDEPPKDDDPLVPVHEAPRPVVMWRAVCHPDGRTDVVASA